MNFSCSNFVVHMGTLDQNLDFFFDRSVLDGTTEQTDQPIRTQVQLYSGRGTHQRGVASRKEIDSPVTWMSVMLTVSENRQRARNAINVGLTVVSIMEPRFGSEIRQA